MTETTPSPDERRAHVERLLDNPTGRRSPRTGELLRYLVEAQIAGEEVTAYSIAFDVFERGADFDPGADPIVRVQMGRLRKFLADRAAEAPGDAPLRLTLQPRTYAPTWEQRVPVTAATRLADATRPRAVRVSPVAAAAVALVAGIAVVALLLLARPPPGPVDAVRDGPVLAVLPFSPLNLDPGERYVGVGLQQRIGVDLWRFRAVRVLLVDDSTEVVRDEDGVLRYAPTGGEIDYVLSGTVIGAPGSLAVTTRLENARTGERLWQMEETSKGSAGRYADVIEAIATNVAAAVGRPLGPVGRDALAFYEERAEDTDRPAYFCYLAFAAWERGGANLNFEEVRDCLSDLRARRIATSDTLSAEAWLNALTTDPTRALYRPGQIEIRLARSLQDARQAVRLDPVNDLAQGRLGLVHWINHQEEAAVTAFRLARDLNPSYPIHEADLGLFLCMMGRCEAGIAHSREALARDPNPPPWYHAAPTIHALLEGDYREAHAQALRVTQSTDVNDCGYLAAASGYLGIPLEDPHCLEVLEAFSVRFGDPIAGLRFWLRDPDLIAVIEEGVRRAGF